MASSQSSSLPMEFYVVPESEAGIHLIYQPGYPLYLVLNLLRHHEDVGVILGAAAHAHEPVEGAGFFVPVNHWVTDIRESFAGAETVMHYLGRYTHRIAIGNSRMDGRTVTIKVKDYRSGGQ